MIPLHARWLPALRPQVAVDTSASSVPGPPAVAGECPGLDIVLTQNELLREDDPRKFKVGYLTDYLVPGYDQMK